MNKFTLYAEKKGKDGNPMYGKSIYPPADDQFADFLQLAKNDRELSSDISNVDKKSTKLSNGLTNRVDAIEIWVEEEIKQVLDVLKTNDEVTTDRIDSNSMNLSTHSDKIRVLTDKITQMERESNIPKWVSVIALIFAVIALIL